MEQKSNKIIVLEVNQSQMKDSGMAFALICFFLGILLHHNYWLLAGIALQLINMINSKFFRYPAVFWFSLANLLGFVTSKILLTLIFCIVILPIGTVRKLLAKTRKNRNDNKLDSLKLLQWKLSDQSVFKTRDHIYTKQDIINPY
jgi:hypothetical protein